MTSLYAGRPICCMPAQSSDEPLARQVRFVLLVLTGEGAERPSDMSLIRWTFQGSDKKRLGRASPFSRTSIPLAQRRSVQSLLCVGYSRSGPLGDDGTPRRMLM